MTKTTVMIKICLTDIKTYYKAMAIQKISIHEIKRERDQMVRKAILKTNRYICGNLAYDRGGLIHGWRKNELFNK